jgi:hypothetical protein
MNGEENNNIVTNQEQPTNVNSQVIEQSTEPVTEMQSTPQNNEQPAVAQEQVTEPATVAQTSQQMNTEAPKQEVVTEVKKEEIKPEETTQPHNPKVNDQVIMEMPKEKDGSVLGILFFFGVIVVFVFFLPNVNKFLGKIFPSLDPTSRMVLPKPVEPVEEDKEKKEEIKYYQMDGMISDAKIDDLSLVNFVKDNNDGIEKIKFYLLNNGGESFNFNDKTKFFLDFYDNNSYLSSVLVYSYDPIASKESKDFTINVSKSIYNKANKFTITRKKTNDYNEVTLNKVEGDYKILTCTFGNLSTNYYFIDNYLEEIVESYTETNDVSTYSEDLLKYNNLASKYQGISSISYDVIESENNFVAKTNIKLKDLNDVDLTKLATYRYFPYHKESKVVAYEMNALGYNCS